jgi:4-amino-4-deoxy-L-arabinose transferase-like glycosyltransferase
VVAAALLLLLQLGLLLHAAWRVGPTIDEHQYVAAGYAYLETGDFARNREHPPLMKLLSALPVWVAGDVWFPAHWRDLVNFPVAFFYQQNLEQLDRNLFLARLLPSLLTVLGTAGVFLVGRRLFGAAGGLTALLLFGFDPNVLAHGSLAALDGGVAVLVFGAVAAFVALLERPSAGRALAAGVLFGLANLAKFTGLLLLPLELILALVACLRARSARPLGWTALVFLSGLGVFSLSRAHLMFASSSAGFSHCAMKPMSYSACRCAKAFSAESTLPATPP